MRNLYRYFLKSPGAPALLGLGVLAGVFNGWATALLNASYAASRFPVPYYEAQLSFSAEKIKGWYAFLVQSGTLDRYVSTQHIDTLFILSTLLLHLLALLLVSRLFAEESKGRRVMVVCAMLSAIAPLSDQLENLVSYVMLADPAGFPDFLVYLYSSLASWKFAMFAFAYLAASVGVVVGGLRHLLVRRSDTESTPRQSPGRIRSAR